MADNARIGNVAGSTTMTRGAGARARRRRSSGQPTPVRLPALTARAMASSWRKLPVVIAFYNEQYGWTVDR